MTKSSWEGLIKLCFSLETPEALSHFMTAILTAEEKENLEKRYLIFKELLLKARTQREIASIHQVSIASITRGSNELKRMQPQMLSAFKKHFGIE